MWAAGAPNSPTQPEPPNAGAFFGKLCLTPRKVNEFVTLAVTHPVDGHASGAGFAFAPPPAAGS
jgi:hypothetical protein